MSITEARVIPLGKLRVYQPGSGDARVEDQGWRWYDLLEQSAGEQHLGTWERNSGGMRLLEVLPGVGLVNRAFPVLLDTRSANWTTSGGTWSEAQPLFGGTGRKYRLHQHNAGPDITWAATSSWSLPANPHFMISLFLQDTPSDHNTTTYPPYIRIEFGGSNEWAILLDKNAGSFVCRYRAGVWEPVAELEDPAPVISGDANERQIIVRHYRDRLWVQTVFGGQYVEVQDPYGANGAASVPAGSIVVRGQGQTVGFGIHALRYYSGYWQSPTQGTNRVRAGAVPTISGKYSQPAGTTVTWTDQSPAASQSAAYRVSLAPASHSRTPGTFYSGPSVQATIFRYPVSTGLQVGVVEEPYDQRLLSFSVDKPIRLDEGSATVEVDKDAASIFTFPGRWRKAEVHLGEYLENGTSQLWQAFTGYIRVVRRVQSEYNQQRLQVQIENRSQRLKRTYWGRDTVPLGDQTVNQAADEVLQAAGLQASDRNWDALGDLITLPFGDPYDPFLWPQKGDSYWSTLEAIFGYAGLELGVADDGTITSVPLDYVGPMVTYTWAAAPEDDAIRAILGVGMQSDAGECMTGVEIDGIDEATGALISAHAVDEWAEENVLSERYSTWIERHQETVPGTCTPGMLTLIAQARYKQYCLPKEEVDLEVPGNLGVGRRDRVQFTGVTLGTSDTDVFKVLTISHRWVPVIAECQTTIGVRRLTA